MHRSVLPRYGFQALVALIVCVFGVPGCGGSNGPTSPGQSTVPQSVVIQGTTSGTVNDQFPLAAVVTFEDTRTETFTSQATWTTSNVQVATVNTSGLLQLVGPGECEITVSYTSSNKTVTAMAHVVSTTRPVATYTLFGVISDNVTGRAIGGVRVSIIGGVNNARTTTTDGNGYYSIPTLIEGTLGVRFAADGYQTLDQEIPLTTDTRRDFTLTQIPLPTFSYTYNISITEKSNDCKNITSGTSGTITLSGTNRDLRVSITENRSTPPNITRDGYRGSMSGDGSFSATGSGLTNIVRSHEFRGSISGKVTGNTISGTETMAVTLGCDEDVPNNPPTRQIVLDFSGSR